MSLLSAVNIPNGAFENIGTGHFLGGATRPRPGPQGVGNGQPASARQEGQPGQQPSRGKRPMPTSSQKPGNREGNARIPYARYLFTWMDDRAAPRELQPGDTIFVHKTSQAMGHGANRVIKATGIPQLNNILSSPVAGVTRLDYSDPTLSERVKRVRLDYWAGVAQGLEYEVNSLTDRAKQYPSLDMSDHLGRVTQEHTDAKALRAAAQADVDNPANKLDSSSIIPQLDWQAVSMIGDWSLDGVLINVDDDVDVDDSNSPHLSRDDGILLNVCVQGPTPMRNTGWQDSRMREDYKSPVHHVDNNIIVMDKVFVGLFFTMERDKDSNALRRVGFYYKLFSGRQLHSFYLSQTLRPDQLEPQAPDNGPSGEAFESLCGAWRVGSVMDNRLTTDVERRVLLNVAVEWYPWLRLLREYADPETPLGSPPTLPP